MKTPFYELAEKIGNGRYNQNCGITLYMLFKFKAEYIRFFLKYFDEFNSYDPNHQITALLFADLLWQEEMKGGKK